MLQHTAFTARLSRILRAIYSYAFIAILGQAGFVISAPAGTGSE